MEDENLEDNYEDVNFLPKRHLVLKWSGVFVAVVAVLWLSWELAVIPSNTAELTYAGARQASGREPRAPLALSDGGQFDPAKMVGTSGVAEESAPDAAIQAQIRDLDSIVGNRNPSSLVGQRVTLQVPLVREDNMSVVWVGAPENPLLVVLNRDVRDGFQRMASQPPAHGIQTVAPGQQATISGVILRLPGNEQERYSWDLSRTQWQRVQARGVYLLADSVRQAG